MHQHQHVRSKILNCHLATQHMCSITGRYAKRLDIARTRLVGLTLAAHGMQSYNCNPRRTASALPARHHLLCCQATITWRLEETGLGFRTSPTPNYTGSMRTIPTMWPSTWHAPLGHQRHSTVIRMTQAVCVQHRRLWQRMSHTPMMRKELVILLEASAQ